LDPKSPLDAAAVLKNIPRTGWLQRGVPPAVAETVAEHSFEVASILALIAVEAGDGLDGGKMLIMGIMHDWAEAVVGDIPKPATMRIGRETKSKVERGVIREMSDAGGLGSLSELFNEYEDGKTDEAVLAKIADLLSTTRQADVYLRAGYKVKDISDDCRKEITILIPKVKNGKARDAVGRLL